VPVALHQKAEFSEAIEVKSDLREVILARYVNHFFNSAMERMSLKLIAF